MLNSLTPLPPLRLLLSSTDTNLTDALSDSICLLEEPPVVVVVEAVASVVAVEVATEVAEVASVEAEEEVIEVAEVASVEAEVAIEAAEEAAVVEAAEEDSMLTRTLTREALLPSLEPRCPSDCPYAWRYCQ